MRLRKCLLALAIVVILLINGSGCQTPKSSVPLEPARFVLGDLTITPTAIMAGENVTYSIQVSNIGGTEGSYTVVFKYKSSVGSIGSDNVEVTLKPGQTKTAMLTTTKNESGTYFVNVNDKRSQYTVKPVPIPIRGVPATSASAITSPPPSMVGINTHTEVYGQDADPNMITLGPKLGINPEKPGYATKHSMAWELKIHGTPVLAPIDMVLVGFQNNSAYRITDGQNITRMDDLVLFFESASPDWPGMIIYVYHLSSSPLLLGQDINPDCSACEEGQRENIQAQGHLYMGNMDYVTDKGNAGACEALIGYKVKRGELIGFAGTMPAGVGPHSFVDIGFKVSDTSENPLFGLKGTDTSGERHVQTGNPYLHWVQPGLFFYWKSYSPDANFPSGVLAYPFECDGYQLPAEQHDVNFKYTTKK
ncbi:MAG TPA: hypothetical protein VGA85_01635 [Dehalococcoidales bacterium]